MFFSTKTSSRSAETLESRSRKKYTQLNLDSIWSLFEEARVKDLSLHNLAKVRGSDATGGMSTASVQHWHAKYLQMYKSRCTVAFQHLWHLNLVTDSSCHGTKDTLISTFYSYESKNSVFAMCQVMKSAKHLFPGELELESQVETLAARRELERLKSYRFLQAVSHQLHLLTGGNLDLTQLMPASELCLEPLNPGDSRELDGDGYTFFRAGQVDPIKQTLTDQVPVVSCLMDQGSTGCAATAWLQSKHSLFHASWDKIHRIVRDLKLAASHTGLDQVVLMSSFVFSVNYKPFGSGAWFEEKRNALEAFLQSESFELWLQLYLWFMMLFLVISIFVEWFCFLFLKTFQ